MPVDWSRYPKNWKRIVAGIRRRARGRCEWCGARHGLPHPVTGSKVVLTTAHLGEPFALDADKHDKRDIRAENLAALCQKCHLNHDRDEHRENTRRNREARRLAAEPMLPAFRTSETRAPAVSEARKAAIEKDMDEFYERFWWLDRGWWDAHKQEYL